MGMEAGNCFLETDPSSPAVLSCNMRACWEPEVRAQFEDTKSRHACLLVDRPSPVSPMGVLCIYVLCKPDPLCSQPELTTAAQLLSDLGQVRPSHDAYSHHLRLKKATRVRVKDLSRFGSDQLWRV